MSNLTEEEKKKQEEWDAIKIDEAPIEPEEEVHEEDAKDKEQKPKEEPADEPSDEHAEELAEEPSEELAEEHPEETPEEPAVDRKAVREPQYREIVHNGQVYRLTEQKLIELAQKGFDYDYKVGPHSRIAKLIERYPDLANTVDQYVKGKLQGGEEQTPQAEKPKQAFKPKSIDEYETADEWLEANLSEYVSRQAQTQTVQQPKEDIATKIETICKIRDPHYFSSVYPQVINYIPKLTVGDYDRINNDLGEFLKFYDKVKEQVIKPKSKIKPNPLVAKAQQQSKKPPFKAGISNVQKKQSIDSEEKIWELPNSKFTEIINKARGF